MRKRMHIFRCITLIKTNVMSAIVIKLSKKNHKDVISQKKRRVTVVIPDWNSSV